MPSSNKGTPKGVFKEAQLRHKRQQALYDAIKKAREQGEAFATFHGQRFQLESPSTSCLQPFGFVKLRGRVRLCMIIEKDGFRAMPVDRSGYATGPSVHISDKQFLCGAKILGEWAT